MSAEDSVSRPANGSRHAGDPAASPAGVGQALDALSPDERMLLTLRDELYEGRWDLLVADLKARLDGRPHVFEIGPANARLRQTIATHLRLIEGLRDAETRLGVDLGACVRNRPDGLL